MGNWLGKNRNKDKIERLQKIREHILYRCVKVKGNELSKIRIAKINQAIERLFVSGNEFESQIEEKMYQALTFIFRSWEGEYKIIPQLEVGKYRIDLAVITNSLTLAVECDGYQYHDRKPEQVIHDKKRDRYLLINGFPVMHFAGTEINKDAEECALDVFQYIIKFAKAVR